jgi:hypothetical protein
VGFDDGTPFDNLGTETSDAGTVRVLFAERDAVQYFVVDREEVSASALDSDLARLSTTGFVPRDALAESSDKVVVDPAKDE